MRMIIISVDSFDDFFNEALQNFRFHRGKVENQSGKDRKVTDAVAALHEEFAQEVAKLKKRIESSR